MRSFSRKVSLLVIVLVILADQASKSWVLQYGATFSFPLKIFTILDVVLVWNRGISWGFFNHAGAYNTLVFGLAAAIISAVLIVLLWKAESRITAGALSLMIGGALGNLIDRLRFGGVVDFIYFHWNAYGFPAFNIADAAITLGVALMFLEAFLDWRGKKKYDEI